MGYLDQLYCHYNCDNTPGTRGGPGGRDQTLAVKIKKNARKSVFFRDKKKHFFVVKDGEREREKERPKVGNNKYQVSRG